MLFFTSIWFFVISEACQTVEISDSMEHLAGNNQNPMIFYSAEQSSSESIWKNLVTSLRSYECVDVFLRLHHHPNTAMVLKILSFLDGVTKRKVTLFLQQDDFNLLSSLAEQVQKFTLLPVLLISKGNGVIVV